VLVFNHSIKDVAGKNVPEEMSSLFSSCIKTLNITRRRAMMPSGEKAWLPEESIQALLRNIARIKMSPKFQAVTQIVRKLHEEMRYYGHSTQALSYTELTLQVYI
jgi:hypothetical protein